MARTPKTAPGRIKKPKTVSRLKKDLDIAYGRYIRQRDNHICYTCSRVMEPKESQCGHYVPRQYLSLRFDERNTHAQCYACNMLYNGQPSAYALHLLSDYGKDILEELERKRREITKLSTSWYEERLEHYKALLQ